MARPDNEKRPTELGLFIQQHREGRGATLEGASRDLGVTKNTLLSYEQGRTLPELSFLALLALKFGADFTTGVMLRLALDKNKHVASATSALSIEKLEVANRQAGQVVRTIRTHVLAKVIEAVESTELRSNKVSAARRAHIVCNVYHAAHGLPFLKDDVLRATLDRYVRLYRAGEEADASDVL